MRLTAVSSLVLIGIAAAGAPCLSQEPLDARRLQALEERAFFRTIEEQGGCSHDSGDRPELGPVLLDPAPSFAPQILRVGITPSSFDAAGNLVSEYLTSAAHNHTVVETTGTGFFDLLDPATGALLAVGWPGQGLAFARASLGGPIAITLKGVSLGSHPGPLRVRAADDSLLVVNSIRRLNRLLPPIGGVYQYTPAPYHGELAVYASEADPAKLRLANLVDIENYVPGVVVNESLGSFHREALRAQAITARGYALANIGRFNSRGFDIDDSTSSQVYRGQSSETAVALDAAKSTSGLVITRNDRLVSALYSSSMGGHTESNEYVFPVGGYPGTNPDPALRGIHDSADPLAVDLSTDAGVYTFYTTVYPGSSEVSPVTGNPLTSLHRWTRTRTAAELLSRLKESFGVPSSAAVIDDIQITLRGASGRMMRAAIDGDWGQTTVSGWSDLRRLATLSGVTPGGTAATSAPNSPSTFVITRDGANRVASLVFYGGGFGHNVGMSQYGAQGRALRGQTAEQILQSYYSGVTVGPVPSFGSTDAR